MKNVGIITFHCADNFGAVLQVYALQQIIKEMKVSVEIIDFRPNELIDPYNHSIEFDKIYKNHGIKGVVLGLLSKLYNYRNIENRMNGFEKFRNTHLNLSKEKYYTPNDLLNKVPNYEYYITGSDQVWNPYFKKEIGDSYFLDFVKENAIKISYAASIAEELEDTVINDYKKYINKFDFISIREQSSLAFINNITNKNVEVTLDPTLLLTGDNWNKLSRTPEINEKYILVYDLQHNNELIKLANRLSDKTGYKVVCYSNKKHFPNSIQSFRYQSPEDFLGLFEKAELILTTSFHGTVFSVINNKPFYTIPHSSRGSRMIDLLKVLNLENRILNKADDLEEINYDIDYKKVNINLEEKRKESISFLKQSLNISGN